MMVFFATEETLRIFSDENSDVVLCNYHPMIHQEMIENISNKLNFNEITKLFSSDFYKKSWDIFLDIEIEVSCDRFCIFNLLLMSDKLKHTFEKDKNEIDDSLQMALIKLLESLKNVDKITRERYDELSRTSEFLALFYGVNMKGNISEDSIEAKQFERLVN